MIDDAQQHPGTKSTISPAEDNRKTQGGPNETQMPSQQTHIKNTVLPHTAKPQAVSSKSPHTQRMYTGMRPHVPGHQDASHTVPTLIKCHIPPRVCMQCYTEKATCTTTCRCMCVAWRKLQTPCTPKEHNKLKNTYSQPKRPSIGTTQTPSTGHHRKSSPRVKSHSTNQHSNPARRNP